MQPPDATAVAQKPMARALHIDPSVSQPGAKRAGQTGVVFMTRNFALSAATAALVLAGAPAALAAEADIIQTNRLAQAEDGGKG
jgi:hypothetical protein